MLIHEVDLATLSASLALSRDADALALLDRFDVTEYAELPHPETLRLARAELLAEAGRCAEAAPVFAGALAGPLRERALFGAARCASPSAARPAFERYLAEYPRGRFAAQARTAIGAPESGL